MAEAIDPQARDGRAQATFGDLLKRHRVSVGLTQEALAERARLSARAISAYERGLRKAPYRDTLGLLVQALGLSGEETVALQATVSRRRGPKASTRSPNQGTSASHALGTRRTNLPALLTSFVGRQREIAEVQRLAVDARLLTLVGTGGCGKTRLAFQVAGGLLDRFADGVWIADLAPIADPSLVTQAVAAAVGVREETGQPLLVTLLAALRTRHLLVVLDNCEHLLDACAHLANTLLQSCPHLRMLATSREALGVAGEIRRRVPSLTVPAPEPLPPIENLRQYEAVQLFLDRAMAVEPSFRINHQNARAVAQICWRLDGIPLAIELAAARVRVLTAEQVAARLDDRFRLLTGGSRTALRRHQTLQATVDWSYQLLSDAERAFLRRLAVFAGGWDLEAAEAVGAGDGAAASSVLDLLTALVDKSWVIAEGRAGEERYRLLETIRHYAGEKLRESGDGEAVRMRYRAWYRALTERAEPELSGPRQSLWLDRLERDYDNVSAVLEGSVDDVSRLEEGMLTSAALLRLWIVRGRLGEGRRLLTALLASAAATPTVLLTPARMAALYAAGFIAYFQGDFATTGSLAEEWLKAARDLGDERGIWLAIDMHARVAMNQGDYPRAKMRFADGLAAMRRMGDRFGICSGLVGLGVMARLEGDYDRATALCEECLAVSREEGDVWFVGQALSNLGLAHYQRGDFGAARDRFEEALTLRRELHDRSGIAWSLINLGDVEQARGDVAVARARFEGSLAIVRELGDRSGSADALASLGRVAQAQGDFDAERTCYVESLVLRRDLGHRLAMPSILESLAGLAAARERHAPALTLAGAAAALRHALGAPQSPAERDQIERWLGPVRNSLSDEASEGAWAEGQAMTFEQAAAFALADDPDA